MTTKRLAKRKRSSAGDTSPGSPRSSRARTSGGSHSSGSSRPTAGARSAGAVTAPARATATGRGSTSRSITSTAANGDRPLSRAGRGSPGTGASTRPASGSGRSAGGATRATGRAANRDGRSSPVGAALLAVGAEILTQRGWDGGTRGDVWRAILVTPTARYAGTGPCAWSALAWCLDDWIRRGIWGEAPSPARAPALGIPAPHPPLPPIVVQPRAGDDRRQRRTDESDPMRARDVAMTSPLLRRR